MNKGQKIRYGFVGLAPLAALAMIVASCEDDPHDGGPYDCAVGDPIEGRECECTGNECVCPSSGDCAVYCVDDCGLQCAGSGSCDFLCTYDCDVNCTGSGNCDVEVGQGSTITCSGSGDCDITCTGDCSVACPGSATCTVHCAVDATCQLEPCSGEVQQCPNDVQICNGGCP